VGDLVTAVGLVLVLEGAMYALAPDQARRAMAVLLAQPASVVRAGGIVAVLAGFVIVWAVRG
jgi:uncharacterized protein YjeT (DUF2065 family)